MTSKNVHNSSSVDIGISAKAVVEAKVSTEIPSASSGRLLDALTDILRPFAEKRGLLADRIRLQREDVLIEIAGKARERLAIEGKVASPLPNKFLVPLLEKASLEEPGGILVERWADLLANASLNPDSAHPRFIQVLSEMSVADAELLQKISMHGIDYFKYPRQAFYDSPLDFSPKFIRDEVSQVIEKSLDNIEGLYDEIFSKFENPGVYLIDISAFNSDPEEFYSCRTDKDDVISHAAFNLTVLVSLGLIREYELEFTSKSYQISVSYVVLTELGTDFISKCDSALAKILASQPPSSEE